MDNNVKDGSMMEEASTTANHSQAEQHIVALLENLIACKEGGVKTATPSHMHCF